LGQDWASRDLTESFPEFVDVPRQRRNRWVNERLWADLLPRRQLDELRGIAADFEPDLVISGRAELTGPTVAELAGIPHVLTSAGRVIALRSFLREIRVARERWRDELGLPPDPRGERLFGDLYVSMIPPIFFGDRLPRRRIVVRPESFGRPAGEAVPDWLRRHGTGSTGYVTLGSAYGYQFPHLFTTVVEGLADVMSNVLVTTGPAADRSDQLPRPAGDVGVAGYIAQSRVMPHIDVVVCHGGSGTIFGALAHGVPVLVIADEQSDHLANGHRCAELGVGAVLPAARITPDLVATAARTLLHRRVAEASRRVQAAIANLPPVAAAARAIAEVAGRARPVRPAGADGPTTISGRSADT
jgi:hypothetical protein